MPAQELMLPGDSNPTEDSESSTPLGASTEYTASPVSWLRLGARLVARLCPGSGFLALLALGVVLTTLWLGHVITLKPITIEINGQTQRIWTHQATPRGVLREVGLVINGTDIVEAELDQPLLPGEPLVVHKARPFVIEADGQINIHYTHSHTPADLLREAGILLGDHDETWLDGQRYNASDPLPASQVADRGPGLRNLGVEWIDRTTHLLIRRAVPLVVNDGAVRYSLLTTAASLGQALLDAGIMIYQADQIYPGLMSAIRPGMRVMIDRSKPLTILADNRGIATRSREESVGDILRQENIELGLKDYCIPGEEVRLTSDMHIRVVRVTEKLVYEDGPIEFETVWHPDSNLDIDLRQVQQSGKEGIERRRIRLHFEDGIETYRVEEESWVAQEPTTRVIAYGTKIVERQVNTADGTISYWRKLRVNATAYTPATCGKTPDHPQYGITRLGWQATKGIIAVDPRVISLRTKMYVPNYGFGTAADTGGAIKWRRIDLCYDEDNLVHWYSWVDAYLLWPPPPSSQIQWIIPDWPVER